MQIRLRKIPDQSKTKQFTSLNPAMQTYGMLHERIWLFRDWGKFLCTSFATQPSCRRFLLYTVRRLLVVVKMNALVAALLIAAAHATATTPWAVTVSPNGAYSVTAGIWPDLSFQSESAPQVMVNGRLQLLQLVSAPVTFAGKDALGSYSGTAMSWSLSGSQVPVLMTTINVYDDVPGIVFDCFVATDVSTGSNFTNRDLVSTSFPAFAAPTNITDIGIMQFSGTFIDSES